jgi:MOSC domain-containing protein YiiM
MFSENFTLQGLMENDVTVGDIFQIESSKVNPTPPRISCNNPGIRCSTMHVIKKFLAGSSSRICFEVSQESEVVCMV